MKIIKMGKSPLTWEVHFWESEQVNIFMYPLEWWFCSVLFCSMKILEKYIDRDWITWYGYWVEGSPVRHYTFGPFGIDVRRE